MTESFFFPSSRSGKNPFLPDSARLRHVYVPGKTGYGKSTLLFWMAAQDIFQGKGVCVIDPKGDLVRLLLDYIPESRKDDVLWLDLNHPVALDFMDYGGGDDDDDDDDEREKERLIGELRFLLTKQERPENAPLMSANIEAILYTLFNFNENPKTQPDRRATFVDIGRFLTHDNRRNEILAGLTDPKFSHLWKGDFSKAIQPIEIKRITTRTNKFFFAQSLNKIFDAPQPKLNIARAMEEKKILLVNIGGVDEVQRMYATLIISKIRDAAYRRANPKYPRIPYYLYCDEFQMFQTSDFDLMLSMARGYGLALTLANQYVHQLESQILHSITGNASTFICFQLGGASIAALRHELTDHWAIDRQIADRFLQKLATLQDFEAVYRDMRGNISKINTPRPIAFMPQYKKTGFAEYIKKRTIERYSSATVEISYDPDSVHSAAGLSEGVGSIEPGPQPSVPPYPRQARRPRPPR
jgi:hypothetical protein